MFKHFLFTRFNLRFDIWANTTKSGSDILSEAWLVDRFRLFETYCLPSVQNQSNQDFTWFIFFDIKTPDAFKQRIDRLQEQYSNLRPLFIDGGGAFKPAIIETIKANINEKDRYVLSSRIDNDDSLHKDFVATIQSLFQPIHNHVIDIRSGYQLVIRKDKNEIFKLDNYTYNPFISVVEDADKAKSTYWRAHQEWGVESSVTIYDQKRLWLQIIHSNNLLNRIRNQSQRVYKFRPSDFGLAENAVQLPNLFQAFLSNLPVTAKKLFLTYKRKTKQWLPAKPASKTRSS